MMARRSTFTSVCSLIEILAMMLLSTNLRGQSKVDQVQEAQIRSGSTPVRGH